MKDKSEISLEARLIAAGHKNKNRRNFALIASMRDQIENCLAKGWTLKDIYTVLQNEGNFKGYSYDSFRNKLIDLGIHTPKKRKSVANETLGKQDVPVEIESQNDVDEKPIPGLELSEFNKSGKPISRFGQKTSLQESEMEDDK